MVQWTVPDPADMLPQPEPPESAVTIRLAPDGGLEWDEQKRLKTSGGGGTTVTSVNGKTGEVVLAAADVGALTQAVADGRYVAKGAAGSVTTGMIADGAVLDVKLANGAVVLAKLAAGVTSRLLLEQAPAQADSTATDVAGLLADFNALLAKLRTAGVIATA